MSTKNKLLYVTPEQQEWLSNLVLDRIHNPLDTNDIVLAAAFIKKLRGRQEKGTSK
jgi:hypothetical protein